MAFQRVSDSRVFSPEQTAIYDLVTDGRVWSSANPSGLLGINSLAGDNVVFAQNTEVRIEPR